MPSQRPLRGSCSCGRNRYTVTNPQNSTDVATVFFDNGHAHRRSQATPLSAWLRVPLSWYHSSTYAFFEDETHNSLRRSYTSPSDENSIRIFCGFCGTPLSYWSESPSDEADYISLTLGSLSGSDLRDLEELGLLPKEAYEEAEDDKEKIEMAIPHIANNGMNVEVREDLPWFETMVEGSRLGNIKGSSGERQSRDGKVKVEWEIVEWNGEGGEEQTPSTGKRKLDDSTGEEQAMEGLQ